MNTATGKTIFRVDASGKSVKFSESSLTFRPNVEEEDQILPDTQALVKLHLEEGVAMPKEGGECGSEAKYWTVTIKGMINFVYSGCQDGVSKTISLKIKGLFQSELNHQWICCRYL